MKVLLLALLLIVSLTGPAWARLGETEDQLVARYGKEIGRGSGHWNKAAPDSIQFIKGGFFIVVWLLNGVSAEENIAKEDYIRGGKHDPLTNEEVKTLVNDNAQGHTWTEVTEGWFRRWWYGHRGMKWQRDDGAIAGVSSGHEAFDVKSKELMDANVAVDKPASSSLEGF